MSTLTSNVTKVSTKRVNLSEVEEGNLFSEVSHYVVTGVKKGNDIMFKHLESGETITLSNEYVQNLLTPADQFTTVVRVGKEDKYWTEKQIADAVKDKSLAKDSNVRVGDLRQAGIRTIWEGIRDTRVFTVCFETQDKPKTKKDLEAEREAQRIVAIEAIEKAANSKKGVANAAKKVLQELQENPVSLVERGKDRVLRGYKDQFVSRDGKYNCIDVDVKDVHNIRPVNINTIKWLVVDNVHYIVD